MADHVREDETGYDLDYKAKYEAYLEWLDEQDAKAEKPQFSKTIVVFCILTTIAFTVTCLFFYWNGKTIDPVLIGFFFSCYGLEFGSLAFIQRGKLKYVGGKVDGKQMGHVEIEEDDDGEVSEP